MAAAICFLSACGGSSDSMPESPTPPIQASDTTPPVITLNGAAQLVLTQGKLYVELGATATDNVDGSIDVNVTGAVNSTEAGEYVITYSATDSAGNASHIERSINVQAFAPFITTWDTTKSGVTDENQIKIDTYGSGFDYTIDWGDGSVDYNVSGDIVHTYQTAGIYTVQIFGDFPHFYMAEVDSPYPNAIHFDSESSFTSDNSKLISVEQWGDQQWASMHSSFRQTSVLAINATDSPDLSNVTDMSHMFFNTFVLSDNQGDIADLANWDTSKVTNMSHLFYGSNSFSENATVDGIQHWNVSNVTDMSYMFSNVYAISFDLNSWNVSSVSTMQGMFSNITFAGMQIDMWDTSNVTNMSNMFRSGSRYSFGGSSISNWDVSNVTNMESMFAGHEIFNDDLSRWQVSKVTNMSQMFNGAVSFNKNIGTWNTESVSTMSLMFFRTEKFNQDLNQWDVSNVTDMSYMFAETKAFNENITSWDVSSSKTTRGMFRQAEKFNQDLGNWNVSNVEDMVEMFSQAKAFNQNLSKWQVTSVFYKVEQFFNDDIGGYEDIYYGMNDMFSGVTLSPDNYDALLISWSQQDLNTYLVFDGGDSQYSLASQAARQSLIDTFNWTIKDGGLNN